MKLRTMLMTLVVALVAGLAGMGTMSASAGGNGATPIDGSGCVTAPWGSQCWEQHGIYNQTVTPSGNSNLTGHFAVSWTNYDALGNVMGSSTNEMRYHALLKTTGAIIQEQGNHSTGVIIAPNGDRWCFSGDFHVVGGKIQYNNLSSWAC